MRKPGGLILAYDIEGRVDETDTFTCGHCNKVVAVAANANPDDLGGMCRCCQRMICPRCVDLGRCDPIEEKLKRAEASYHARRSYG